MANLEIQNAFLDGIEEIYSIMFTDRLFLSLMDEENTVTNVYDETPEKIYHEPIQLIGRIRTSVEQGENPVESLQVDAVITLPTKQLISNEIAHETWEDLETLRKGKFKYEDIEYLVNEVRPNTLVADKWQMYNFYCSKDKLPSLGGD